MWVLVIDDAVSNIFFITEALKSLNHHVVASSDAEEALALLKQMTFDCIFVDFRMPHINGSAFLASLQTKLITSDRTIPVLVMTADTSPELINEVMNLGALAVLHKPISIGTLATVLEGLRR